MTLDEAIKILELHNKWRRGELDDGININASMQNPTDIGIAIDVILEKVKDTLHYDKKL